jgi:CMP/dCMP kinase
VSAASRSSTASSGGLTDFVLAIDGPGGVGKSAVSRRVARRLGLRYLDTGAMYRAVTQVLLDKDVALTDPDAVAAAAAEVHLEIGTDPVKPTIRADGLDVSKPIRSAAVTAAVSGVSAVPAVRTMLVRLQRSEIGAGGIVVEGRDIGTVVVPDAPLKVFLTAEPEVRAQRRSSDRNQPSEEERRHVEAIQRDLARRDALDSTRAVSPLVAASDAVVVDTTSLGLNQVVALVEALAVERGAEPVSV